MRLTRKGLPHKRFAWSSTFFGVFQGAILLRNVNQFWPRSRKANRTSVALGRRAEKEWNWPVDLGSISMRRRGSRLSLLSSSHPRCVQGRERRRKGGPQEGRAGRPHCGGGFAERRPLHLPHRAGIGHRLQHRNHSNPCRWTTHQSCVHGGTTRPPGRPFGGDRSASF